MNASAKVIIDVDEVPVTVHLDVDFVAHCDPGCTYGPPENCYPPEYECEIESAMVDGIDYDDEHEPTEAEYAAAQAVVDKRLNDGDEWEELVTQLYEAVEDRYED